MAGDGDRQGIGPASLGHGTHGLRLPDSLGDVGVARRRAGWYLTQRFPDALLEGGAADIEGEVEPDRWHLHESDHPGDELLEVDVAADELGSREEVLEIMGKLGR